MQKNKVVISFSGGKDSILALHKVIEKGYIPVALLITIDSSDESSYFHYIKLKDLKKISESLNIRLIPVVTTAENYEEKYVKTLMEIKEKEGISACVFGDIDICHHREWGERISTLAGIESIFPLWNQEREVLIKEFIDLGYEAIIKKIDLNSLPVEFLGKRIVFSLLEELKVKDVDFCGENGEYHTIVIDGPLFSKKLFTKKKRVFFRKQYAILEIELE